MTIWEILVVVLVTLSVLVIGWSMGRADTTPKDKELDNKKELLNGGK